MAPNFISCYTTVTKISQKDGYRITAAQPTKSRGHLILLTFAKISLVLLVLTVIPKLTLRVEPLTYQSNVQDTRELVYKYHRLTRV